LSYFQEKSGRSIIRMFPQASFRREFVGIRGDSRLVLSFTEEENFVQGRDPCRSFGKDGKVDLTCIVSCRCHFSGLAPPLRLSCFKAAISLKQVNAESGVGDRGSSLGS